MSSWNLFSAPKRAYFGNSSSIGFDSFSYTFPPLMIDQESRGRCFFITDILDLKQPFGFCIISSKNLTDSRTLDSSIEALTSPGWKNVDSLQWLISCWILCVKLFWISNCIIRSICYRLEHWSHKLPSAVSSFWQSKLSSYY